MKKTVFRLHLNGEVEAYLPNNVHSSFFQEPDRLYSLSELELTLVSLISACRTACQDEASNSDIQKAACSSVAYMSKSALSWVRIASNKGTFDEDDGDQEIMGFGGSFHILWELIDMSVERVVHLTCDRLAGIKNGLSSRTKSATFDLLEELTQELQSYL